MFSQPLLLPSAKVGSVASSRDTSMTFLPAFQHTHMHKNNTATKISRKATEKIRNK